MAFNFDRFISQMNDTIDKVAKEKKFKDDREFEYKQSFDKRQMDLQDKGINNQYNLASRQMDLQKKQYDDAANTEYNRRKQVFDVQAGNMNPDTYAALYGGSIGDDDGNLRGKKGSKGDGGNGEPDYGSMITKAYEASKAGGDQTSYLDFANEAMNGAKDTDGKVTTQGLRALLGQQGMTAGQSYNRNKLEKDKEFGDNVSMSRDANGRMKFGIGLENSVTGFGNVKSATRTLRDKDPIMFKREFQSMGDNPSNPMSNPSQTSLQMGGNSSASKQQFSYAESPNTDMYTEKPKAKSVNIRQKVKQAANWLIPPTDPTKKTSRLRDGWGSSYQ